MQTPASSALEHVAGSRGRLERVIRPGGVDDNVELGRQILADSDVDLITADTLAEAAEKAVAAARSYEATLAG